MSLPRGTSIENPGMLPALIFQSHRDDFKKIANKVENTTGEESILPKIFFHDKNIDLLQKHIIINVFQETNGAYIIPKQDRKPLMEVMKSIYNIYATNQPTNIKKQIEELNWRVTNRVVPHIISEIEVNNKYLRDISNPINLMDLPKNDSKKGSKTLPSWLRS